MRDELVRLGGGAHALAAQLLGNSQDAADAVQDAFEAALARPGSYDAGRGPLKPWFMRVVRNRCLDMLRRRRGASDGVDAVADTASGPEGAAVEAQESLRLRRALAALDRDKREIIVLRDYLDLSYAEIGGVLGVAPGTVMSRLHRARTALKEVYYGNDERAL